MSTFTATICEAISLADIGAALYDADGIVDAAPELEARLLNCVAGESAETDAALLDALWTIIALRREVVELQDRLEESRWPDTRW